jgi:hypothetical protein
MKPTPQMIDADLGDEGDRWIFASNIGPDGEPLGPTCTAPPLVASIDAARLPGIIDLWLWEFEDPANWPTPAAVRYLIHDLERRPDSTAALVIEAIEKCRDYLATAAPTGGA